MGNTLPSFTAENAELTRQLETLHREFLDLFTRHREMVENDSSVLSSLYLEKLGRLQLELLEKQTEASRLRMRMKMIQATINRDEKPDLKTIDREIQSRLEEYYNRIREQSEALDMAQKVLSNLMSEEETQKIREVFRVLCKRLHPDLNPTQTEDERELFIKVKAAYDLHDAEELQKILLYLDESRKEDLKQVSCSDKEERIRHLEKNIALLSDKMERLKENFPFTIEDMIRDEEQVKVMQDNLRQQIKNAEEEIDRYSNIIDIMCDE